MKTNEARSISDLAATDWRVILIRNVAVPGWLKLHRVRQWGIDLDNSRQVALASDYAILDTRPHPTNNWTASYVSDADLRSQRDAAIRDCMELQRWVLVLRRERWHYAEEHNRLATAMGGLAAGPDTDPVAAAWRANAVCVAADRIELDHPHVPGHTLPPKRKGAYGKPCPGCALRDALLVWRPMGKP